jgi:hypothetical protein
VSYRHFTSFLKPGSKKEIPTIEIVEQNGFNQKTAWQFKRSFQELLSVQDFNLFKISLTEGFLPLPAADDTSSIYILEIVGDSEIEQFKIRKD